MADRFRQIGLLFGLVLAGFMIPALGEPVRVDTSLGIRFSDNVDQTENGDADVRYRPAFSLAHSTGPGRCRSDLNADLAYLFFQQGESDNEADISLGWNGDCEIITGLRWQARDSIRQVVEDNRQVDIPDNRERRNVFATGPQWTLPVTRRDSLQLAAEWQQTRFQNSEEDDSERWTGRASWLRNFSALTSGSLNASLTDAEFDNGQELTQQNFSLGLDHQRQRTRLSGQVGYSIQDTEVGSFSNSNDAITWQFSVDQALTHVTDLRLSLSRDLTDSSTDLDIQLGGVDLSLGDTQSVEITRLEGELDQELGGATSVSLFSRYIRSDYADENREDESWINGISLNRDITELLRINAEFSREQEDFQPDDQQSDRLRYALGMAYQRTDQLNLRARIGRETREADAPLTDFDENWIELSITYNLR